MGSSRSPVKFAIAADLEANSGRKALILRVTRLTVDDDRDHPSRMAQGLETPDFLVDVFAACGIGRADDNEEIRRFERLESLFGKRMSGREIFTVAKDRPQ
jgi:hypothetical protein